MKDVQYKELFKRNDTVTRSGDGFGSITTATACHKFNNMLMDVVYEQGKQITKLQEKVSELESKEDNED